MLQAKIHLAAAGWTTVPPSSQETPGAGSARGSVVHCAWSKEASCSGASTLPPRKAGRSPRRMAWTSVGQGAKLEDLLTLMKQNNVSTSRSRTLRTFTPQASYSPPPPSTAENEPKPPAGQPLPPSAGTGNSGASYLSMWKRAREREEEGRRQSDLEARKAEDARRASEEEAAAIRRREQQFQSILQVPEEEKQKAERQALIDRAAAALAAAQAVLTNADGDRSRRQLDRGRPTTDNTPGWAGGKRLSIRATQEPIRGPAVSKVHLDQRKEAAAKAPRPSWQEPSTSGASLQQRLTLGSNATPGPDFWTWAPPKESATDLASKLQRQEAGKAKGSLPMLELDTASRVKNLDLPLESQLSQSASTPSLPPLQSLFEVKSTPVKSATAASEDREVDWDELKAPNLEVETSSMLQTEGAAPEESSGVHPDGSRWWKQTGTEERANGEVCRWTVVRGVSADGAREWEEKWWETSDPFDYKELGAEKSGRDAAGGVWRESWREAMWQDAKNGLMHIEKNADKWARNAHGGEWHEKWWEHYDAQGRAEKWADKWSKIDTSTPLEAGHGHVWHERWGEEYDGRGGAKKYTDKWAERANGDGSWTKWGDKWDERFDPSGSGQKSGETWWEGAYGERWNRTWGEDHNNSGFVHKYGRSSSGEQWDTSEPMDTWYERAPHFGFKHCLDNSRRLQQVGKPPGTKARRKL